MLSPSHLENPFHHKKRKYVEFCRIPSHDPIIRQKAFDFLNRDVYNKKHRRCLLEPDIPCGGNPAVATNTESNMSEAKPQTISRLSAADGLLLFIPKHIENLNENPENRNEPENFLKYMYHLPRFNPREWYSPPSATRGRSGDRLLPYPAFSLKAGKH